MIDRRDFLKQGLVLGGATLAGGLVGPRAAGAGDVARARVVVARDAKLRPGGTDAGAPAASVDPDRLLALLDRSLQTFYDRDNPIEAWRQVIAPGEVVGLKVNCLAGHGLSTTRDLVAAVSERLQQIGVPERSIIVWDRQNADLEDAGFPVRPRGPGVRFAGNDVLGFESNLTRFGSAGSLVCRTLTQVCDAVINLPVLKDHGITGMTCALKNMFGAIHNPNKYHLKAGDPFVADVYSFPPVRDKVRLTICDATTAQYEGGPAFMPHWTWPYNGLIVGTDPVAIDRTAWGIIEQKRAAVGQPSLGEAGREPTYIATAADVRHRLGMDDPARIDVVEV